MFSTVLPFGKFFTTMSILFCLTYLVISATFAEKHVIGGIAGAFVVVVGVVDGFGWIGVDGWLDNVGLFIGVAWVDGVESCCLVLVFLEGF